ncbi:KAP family P-loop NTPase fold protein, partial [Ursidibacter arcticus]
KDRRIADETFFNLYFEQVITPEVIEAQLSRKVWLARQSEQDFKIALSAVPDYYLENVVDNLIEYERDFTKEIALAAIPTLYRNLPRVPEKEKGFFDLDADMIWGRLVYRLLRRLPDKDKKETIMQLLDSSDLYGQYEIVGIIGYREGRGHQLVSELEAKELEEILLNNIRSSTIEELTETYNLSHIIYFFVSIGNAISDDILNSSEVFLLLLKSSISERKYQRGNDPTIHREKVLLWDVLTKIYGDENKVNHLIEETSENEEIKNKDYMQLALKYKSGYRHKESMDDEDDLDEF